MRVRTAMELQATAVSVAHNTCKKCLQSPATRQSTQLRTSVNRQSSGRPDQHIGRQPSLSLPIAISRKPRRYLRCAAQAAASETMKVGFVGVGIMGLAMVGMQFHAYFVAVTCTGRYRSFVHLLRLFSRAHIWVEHAHFSERSLGYRQVTLLLLAMM